jgi:tetratricopeptide (TPR) repeat protein
LADVFLSYARSSAAVAERIARELEQCGWSVWFDRELPAHRAYSDVIATELESASAVLVIWSKDAAISQWVRSEANRARERGKLVQARIDNATLPMPFDQIQCVDLGSWRGRGDDAGWSQVRKSIHALLGSEKGATIPVAPGSMGSRRGILIGGAAAAAISVGGFAWLLEKRDRSNPEAELLVQKGTDALQNNDVFAADDPGSLANAIALLTEATKIDPRNVTGWGSLALAYAALKRVSPVAQRSGLDARSRSAAATALKLKPNEPRATAALLLLDPVYRHWRTAEQADREALKRSPPIPLLNFLLSDTLGNVGRWKEAAAVSIKADRTHFIIPGADRRVVVDLWASGDLQGADQALKLAVDHWPQQPQVWRTRLAYLMYSGRPLDALAILHNEVERPPGTPEGLVQALDATAKALAGQGDTRSAVGSGLRYLKTTPTAVFGVVHACASLGEASTAIALLRGYYFSEGSWAQLSPPGGDQDRQTSPLFMPPMRLLWGDGRFAQLLERIGLDNYWRQSRTVPDFRQQV